MKKIIVFLFAAIMLVSHISAEEDRPFIPTVKFSIGGAIGILSFETEAYKWSGSNYIFDYSGSVVLFNWLSPAFNAMFFFLSANKLCFGFGGNITLALFGLPFTEDDIRHTHPVTGGTLAPYGVMGYNNFILHLGYDFGSGSFYLSPNYIINKHWMVGIQTSPFGNNHQGLYSILLPPKEKISPPEPYWEDKYFQICLSVHYIF